MLADVLEVPGRLAARHDRAVVPRKAAPAPDRRLIAVALLTGLVAQAWGMFRYPLYLTDEGIYIQRAWAMLHEGRLSPYTFFYDHAPAGWAMLAGWVAFLPRQFNAFGNPTNTARVLMLLTHLVAVYLLFDVAWRYSGGNVGAVVATSLFSLSPLGVFYQRQMLLDNLMVLWLLLCMYLIARSHRRLLAAMAAGAALGVAVVTKENSVFFVPVLAFLLYREVRNSRNHRFAKGFWFFAAATPAAFYLMYAVLKGELFPPGLNFSLTSPSTSRVSLLYTIWWQLNRTQGSAVSGHGLFWQMLHQYWLPKDHFLLVGGAAATSVLLVRGLARRHERQAELAAALLAISYGIYLMRGSVLLEFYVIPLVPFLALNLGIASSLLLRRLPSGGQLLALVAALAVLCSPLGGYLVVKSPSGHVQLHDMYRLNLTWMQQAQLAWVEAHVRPSARIIIDDDMWTTLHEHDPPYRFAHSHYEASADPAVRDRVFHHTWRSIDYIVMSNKMRLAMVRNNGDGRETWILDALDNHARQVWSLRRGDVGLSVYKVG